MERRLTDELRAGLASIANLPGVVITANPAWRPERQRWVIPCRIAADVLPDGPIAPVTDWFVLVDGNYPNGRIGIYPAKEGGITQTFPHQDYNGPGKAENSWRSGKLCTWTSVAPLRRKGYDTEPGEPERNLAWHLSRAQKWLELASHGELNQPGDPYELPYIPAGGDMNVAFCEGPSSLRQWTETGIRHGTADANILGTDPPTVIVTRFNTGKRQPPVEQEWRKELGSNESPPVVWIRANSVPVLPPYQIPMTWGELRQPCQLQGIDLDCLLRPAIGNLAYEIAILLIGFPIPEKIGGPDARMHWLALRLPQRPYRQTRGFSDTGQGRWLAYKQYAIHDAVGLDWLKTENWHYDEVSVRGRLSSVAAQQRILIIGAGAVGSALAEMLARAGAWDITVIDSDNLEAGNLVRHTLLATDIGSRKASALADRLDAAALHSSVTSINAAFPPSDAEQAALIEGCDVIIDATGDDAAAAVMSRFQWNGVKTFISVSLGIRAKRLFCFAAHGSAFPNTEFKDRLQQWLQLEGEEYNLDELPRDGPGCWHPRHPARIDDVWMLTAAAVKLVEQAIANPPDTPALTVLEQQTDAAGNFAGIRDVSQYAAHR